MFIPTKPSLHKFETIEEFKEKYKYGTEGYYEPWVSAVVENGMVNYNKTEREKLADTPLTFKIISGGTIVWKASDNAYTKTIEYKKNDGEWVEITSTTAGTSLNVSDGDDVAFRGNNTAYGDLNARRNTFRNSTAMFDVEGNIMSLIDSTGYTTARTLSAGYTFYGLFSECPGLISAEKLILPATSLTKSCYMALFQACTGLTTPPVLPATTLTDGCYAYMFDLCPSLTTAPNLPAMTLFNNCYQNMFSRCTNLIASPELPATTLAGRCYGEMFSGCTGLTIAPALPATALAGNCYSHMFQGCANLTSAPELPATTLAYQCYSGMFYGCTSLTTATELPAATLAYGCYIGMFQGCTSLTSAPVLPATTLASDCYAFMFQGCRSLT